MEWSSSPRRCRRGEAELERDTIDGRRRAAGGWAWRDGGGVETQLKIIAFLAVDLLNRQKLHFTECALTCTETRTETCTPSHLINMFQSPTELFPAPQPSSKPQLCRSGAIPELSPTLLASLFVYSHTELVMGVGPPPPRPPPHYLLYLMGPLLFPHTHLFIYFFPSTLTLRVTGFNIVGET